MVDVFEDGKRVYTGEILSADGPTSEYILTVNGWTFTRDGRYHTSQKIGSTEGRRLRKRINLIEQLMKL